MLAAKNLYNIGVFIIRNLLSCFLDGNHLDPPPSFLGHDRTASNKNQSLDACCAKNRRGGLNGYYLWPGLPAARVHKVDR